VLKINNTAQIAVTIGDYPQ